MSKNQDEKFEITKRSPWIVVFALIGFATIFYFFIWGITSLIINANEKDFFCLQDEYVVIGYRDCEIFGEKIADKCYLINYGNATIEVDNASMTAHITTGRYIGYDWYILALNHSESIDVNIPSYAPIDCPRECLESLEKREMKQKSCTLQCTDNMKECQWLDQGNVIKIGKDCKYGYRICAWSKTNRNVNERVCVPELDSDLAIEWKRGGVDFSTIYIESALMCLEYKEEGTVPVNVIQ